MINLDFNYNIADVLIDNENIKLIDELEFEKMRDKADRYAYVNKKYSELIEREERENLYTENVYLNIKKINNNVIKTIEHNEKEDINDIFNRFIKAKQNTILNKKNEQLNQNQMVDIISDNLRHERGQTKEDNRISKDGEKGDMDMLQHLTNARTDIRKEKDSECMTDSENEEDNVIQDEINEKKDQKGIKDEELIEDEIEDNMNINREIKNVERKELRFEDNVERKEDNINVTDLLTEVNEDKKKDLTFDTDFMKKYIESQNKEQDDKMNTFDDKYKNELFIHKGDDDDVSD